MRRLLPQLIALAAVGIAFGVVYRYFLDDPSEASVANYLRSGVHGMSVAFAAWGVVIYFNLRASRWLRTWPLLAEIALRALVMAITIAAVIAGLEVVIYGRPLTSRWLSSDFPRILAMSFVLSVVIGAIYELVRLIGGRVLLNVILGRYRHPIREDRVMMFLDLTRLHRLPWPRRWVRCAWQELLSALLLRYRRTDRRAWPRGARLCGRRGDCVLAAHDGGLEGRVPRSASLPSGTGSRNAGSPIGTSSSAPAPRVSRRPARGPGGHQRMRGFPTPNRLFWRHDERDGAARLQEHCKAVGRTLLVSADLLRRVRPGPDLRVVALGQAALRGRAASVEIFAVERDLVGATG